MSGRTRAAIRSGSGSVGPLPTLAAVVTALRTAGCVFAEEEARLLVDAASSPTDLAALVDRRVAGEPLEHLLGWVEFCGLRVAVGPGVFVPRRRTELLVDLAVPLLRPDAVVVELCCGAAAIATALGAAVPGLALHAVDVDPAAVRCARRNLVDGHVYEGDLDAPLPAALRDRVDVLVANAPYVPTGAIALMPPEARDHEPRVALDGGRDGLDVARRVIAAAPDWLAPGGSLLFETSESQADTAVALLAGAGLVPRIESDDDVGATVAIGARR
jgi:release factor glutamine methyltransferase